MDDRQARMALSCAVEPATPRVSALVAEAGAPAVWAAVVAGELGPAWARRAERVDLPEILALAARHAVRFVIPGDPEWPPEIGVLDHCELVQAMRGQPFGLWVRGPLPLGEALARSVAIVGSRAATSYGEIVATELAAELAAKGLTVVSGGAFGIDIAAHRGALAVGGATVAVMAGGLDALYPAANTGVLERVGATGLLVSELPPGQRPTRTRFLARNRLIAALAGGTVLVEAAARSGARNTVTWATVCGRPVMAVPGPVSSATSITPHRLIREAEAVLVTCGEEVAELLGPLGRPGLARASQRRPLDDLTVGERAVYEALPARTSLPPGEITLRAALPIGECLGHLEALAERGLIEATAVGYRLVRQAAAPPAST